MINKDAPDDCFWVLACQWEKKTGEFIDDAMIGSDNGFPPVRYDDNISASAVLSLIGS